MSVTANSNTKTDIRWRNYATGGGENAIWVMDGPTLVSSLFLTPVKDLNWVIQATGDLNGDNNTDIIWRNYSTGQEALWFMDGTTLVSSTLALPPVTDLNWQIQGTGDFNNDGKADLVWRNYATGQNVIWFLNGATISSSPFIESLPITSARIQAVADFNNDGNPDILWRN